MIIAKIIIDREFVLFVRTKTRGHRYEGDSIVADAAKENPGSERAK